MPSQFFSPLCKMRLLRSFKFVLLNRVCQTKRCFSTKKKHSFELLPDVSQLFDLGSLKHRNHPGIRKIPPVQIPPILENAVDRLITEEGEGRIRKDSIELLASLYKRRMPLEKEEIEMKIKSDFYQNGDEAGEILETLTKEQLNTLRRQIRRELGRWKPIEYNRKECLAYLVGRLNANYASTWRVFTEIKRQLPLFKPETFFDFGTGVGTAIWAARMHWGESLKEYFCVDSSADMIEVAKALLTDPVTEEEIFKTIYFRQFLPASESRKYDLVVSAFSMLDLPSFEERLRVIDTLWRKTEGVLVIIEHGSFAGFFAVLDARDYILQLENESPQGKSSGAHIVSPCPHEFSCPMLDEEKKKSCGIHVNYETSYPRNRHVIKKDWISYVVLKKGPKSEEINTWPRIVKPILKKSQHLHCRACCRDGKINEVIVTRSKHGRNAYRCARSSHLGDMLPVKMELITEEEVEEEKVNDVE